MDNALDQLRIVRNAYLSDFDEYVLKATATGMAIPTDLQEYMQALRDLPETATPSLDEEGRLDETSFTWPVPPLWWWNSKGFDARSES